MNLFKLNLKALDLSIGSVMTIGNFDGVHLGHQALLNRLIQKSQQLRLPSVVVLFEPHPKELFLRHLAPKRIYTLREKIFYLKQIGIDYVFCINFTPEISNIEPDIFIQTILVERLNVKHLIVGHDFHFGKNRKGNYLLLTHWGKTLDFVTEEFDCVEKDSERVSSTGIRDFLKKGDLTSAGLWLGRSYSAIGRVIYGRQLARLWGIPTANIKIFDQKLSLTGVFCVTVKFCGEETQYKGIANMGYRPTFGGTIPYLEVHLFGFDASIYGKFLEVSFCHLLREEQKFANVSQLREQIEKDVMHAQNYFLMLASQ